MQDSVAESTASNSLANRYGRTQSGRPRNLRVWGIIALIISILVVLWFTISATKDSLDYADVGFSMKNEQEASVRFKLTKDPAREAVCTLDALSDTYATVGYTTVLVPKSTDSTLYYEADVRTDSPATTVVVDTCWYPDEEQQEHLPPVEATQIDPTT